MRVIDLVLKDLSQMVRDRRTLVFFLIMPIVFTLLFGFIFGNTGDGDEEIGDSRLPIAIIVEDQHRITTSLVSVLERSNEFQLVWSEESNQDELRELVADGDISAAIIVPPGYGEQTALGDPIALTVILDSSDINGYSIEQSITGAVALIRKSARAAELSVAVYEEQQSFESDDARQTYFDISFDKTLAIWENPPITTTKTFTGQDEVTTESNDAFGENPYAHSSPGMILQFAIAGLLSTAEIIVNERKSGSLQRLLTTSISRTEILVGHYLAMVAMIFTQIMILMVFGQFVLKLDYLHAPLASLMMAIAISLCVAALGLLIGALSKTPDNTVVYSLIPMFIFSGLGGAWMPLEFTSETVQMVGHFTPVAWGMDGLKNILIRGQGLEAVWLPVGMLMVFTVIFFGLAVWRFKFE